MKKAIIALAAMAASSVAMAGPSWTYADLGYVIGDSDGSSNEVDGFAVRGSLGFASIWHAQLDYSDLDVGDDVEVDGYELRVGMHPAMTDNTDFVLDLGYFDNTEEEDGFSDYDYDGITVRTGVRSNISENLELRAFISLTDWEGEGSDEGREVGYQVGAQYNFNAAWSVGADASLNSSEDDLANIYVRWSFGDLL